MTKPTDTKDRIVDLAETLIRLCGYNGFSYQDISSRLNMKNAAIHYHFPGKEELGVAVIRKTIDGFELMLAEMKSAGLDEYEKLELFIDQVFGSALEQQKVCLVGALSTEFIILPEKMKTEFQLMVMQIENWLIQLLKDGKRKKVFVYTTTPQTKALMIITNMMAALQVARVIGKEKFYLIKKGILQEISNK